MSQVVVKFDYFTIKTLKDEVASQGYREVRVHTQDRFAARRFLLERSVIQTSALVLRRYLTRRPDTKYDSRVNLARNFVYLSPSMRSLVEYMPGGFVTYHAYDPDKKYIRGGKRLDFIARSFFRHSHDGLGIRSRAYSMAWRVHRQYADATEVRWLSIACGVGQATFDAARLLPADTTFLLIDMDKPALAAAEQMSQSYDIAPDRISSKQLNVVSQAIELDEQVRKFAPHVIDAMGLFEYLEPKDATQLIRQLYDRLQSGGMLVFTNMLPSHPHIDIHKRAMGWPGVILREVSEVVDICTDAGVAQASLTVIRPDDDVYAVYEVIKP